MGIHDTKTCRGSRYRLGLSGPCHRISVVLAWEEWVGLSGALSLSVQV